MKRFLRIIITITIFAGLFSCDYLDIVPDNVATIDMAFNMRTTAERYLATCYSYRPVHGAYGSNVGFVGGDEAWLIYSDDYTGTNTWNIGLGNQNIVNPYVSFWTGGRGGKHYFQALRNCNVFLENIDNVIDMDEGEKARWKAEVKFLKAFYHFYLVRCYGPIPIIKDNLAIESETESVRVYRDPVDDCFDYIIELLDECLDELPDVIIDEYNEAGRITKAIALSLKAKVAVTAASPLFNGNTDFATLVDNRGRQLISQEESSEKWDKAVDACKTAINFCHQIGLALYKFDPSTVTYGISGAHVTELSIRNAVSVRWNSEIIWANTQSWVSDLQRRALPKLMSMTWDNSGNPSGVYAPTMKVAETFYTKNGVPIDEDKTWNYVGRYNVRTSTEADKYYVAVGEQSAELHFDREPRFYANLGFDRGVWYGNGSSTNGNYESDATSLLYVKGRANEQAARAAINHYSYTGYYAKKVVHYQGTVNTSTGAFTAITYPWPEMRLADLYLLYAEALNEQGGPTDEAFRYINLVRERAGIPTVQDSWTAYSSEPQKYTYKAGFRDIIQKERMIELALEGHKFWDVRRWKIAHNIAGGTVMGWDLNQGDAASYYRPTVIWTQVFQMKDYFWPIRETDLIQNKNLVQNLGW